jgi:cytochrome c-type biogenesis protein CcmE
MLMVGGVLCGVTASAVLAVQAIRENTTYFFNPSQVAAGEAPVERAFRVGGLVVDGSIYREPGSLTVRFELTDCDAAVPVVYSKLLPDLFGEGQGIVARGQLDGEGTFVAEEVLTKHDENYMSPEVAEAVAEGEKRAGGKCAQTRVAGAQAQ